MLLVGGVVTEKGGAQCGEGADRGLVVVKTVGDVGDACVTGYWGLECMRSGEESAWRR